MKTLILHLFGLLMLSGSYSCVKDPVTGSHRTLVETEWDLESFEVIGVGKSDIGSQGIILVFAEDDTVRGRSWTLEDPGVTGNSYYGTYEAGTDGFLRIDNLGTTYVALPPGSRYEEYFDAIRNSSSFEIEGDRLRILYNDKTKALNFKGE